MTINLRVLISSSAFADHDREVRLRIRATRRHAYRPPEPNPLEIMSRSALGHPLRKIDDATHSDSLLDCIGCCHEEPDSWSVFLSGDMTASKSSVLTFCRTHGPRERTPVFKSFDPPLCASYECASYERVSVWIE